MLRMNSQEDDGQLSAQMIQTLVRMSQNMPAHVKVYCDSIKYYITLSPTK